MKYTFLLSLFLMTLFMPSVFGITHYLIADEDGTAQDVIILADLTGIFLEEGETAVSKLNNEVDATDLSNRVAVYLVNNEALIVAPDEYDNVADKVENYLRTEYGIFADRKEPNQIEGDDLAESCEHCDVEAFIVIYGNNDKLAAEGFSYDLLPDEEVTSDDLSNKPIIVGGPCANVYWSIYSDETCSTWEYESGEAVLRVTKDAILIAGTTKKDTQDLVDKVLDEDIDLLTVREKTYTFS